MDNCNNTHCSNKNMIINDNMMIIKMSHTRSLSAKLPPHHPISVLSCACKPVRRFDTCHGEHQPYRWTGCHNMASRGSMLMTTAATTVKTATKRT